MKTTATLAATPAIAIALAYPSTASAVNKYFNVTVGGPGYAVSVGRAGFAVGYYGGAPVYGTFAPAPVFLPAPVYGPVYAGVRWRRHASSTDPIGPTARTTRRRRSPTGRTTPPRRIARRHPTPTHRTEFARAPAATGGGSLAVAPAQPPR